VLRSRWPNIPESELVDLVRAWGEREGVRVVLVFDGKAPPGDETIGTGAESADDWLAREAARLRASDQPFWLVTSDRELRARAGSGADRVIGGGAFAVGITEPSEQG
jgi:predicted RNA-binding protein with PIN domain